MSKRGQHLAGGLVAATGIICLLIVLMMYYWKHVPITPAPVAVACVIGFVGFYLLDPSGAEDGGNFLVNATIRVVDVVRNGRRASDVITNETTTTVTGAITPGSSETPLPTSADGK